MKPKKYVQFKDCTQININGVMCWICPYCKDHPQGEPMEVHDCKEIIYENELTPEGKLQGGTTQCNCYSRAHGYRGTQ